MTFRRSDPYNSLPLLPPAKNLETRAIMRQAIRAARSLADLKGAAAKMPNQRILINSIVLQEARLSSEIENIVTTSDELYRAAASPDDVTDPHTKEVLGYRTALWHGFNSLTERPLSTNLFLEIVSRIRRVDMEVRRITGTSLKNQLGDVIYTPPVGEEHLRSLLGNLENFIHQEDEIDPLIKLAVMHYQFEAIHPFTDGNGRTGRILNILYLVEQKLLDWPVLYLSDFILRNKASYYAGLRGVTEKQRWEPWILFMLQAVEVTSKQTTVRVQRILESMQKTKETVRTNLPKIYSHELINTIYQNPYCKIQFLADAGVAKRQTASLHLRKLAELGILRGLKAGREMYYVNDALIDILSTPEEL